METIDRTILNSIAIGTALAILATAVHEFVFYSWLAPDLVDLPVASDYLITALRWLPGTVLMAGLGFGIGTILPKAPEKVLAPSSEMEQVPRPWSFHKLFSIGTLRVGFLGVIVLSVVSLVFKPNPSAVIYLIPYVCASFLTLDWSERRWKLRQRISSFLWLAIFFGPIILVAAATYGLRDAQYIQWAEEGNYSIDFKEGHSMEKVLLVRNLSSGVLVAVPGDGQVRFFPWSDVRSVRAQIPALREESVACEWLRTPAPGSVGWILSNTLLWICDAFLPRAARSELEAGAPVPTTTDDSAEALGN